MKIFILICTLLTGASARAWILLHQDPGFGDSAWGSVSSLNIYDDFVVGGPGWEIDRIDVYELYGNADVYGDTYYVEIWNAPQDFGGAIVTGPYSHTDVGIGPIGGYGYASYSVGFQIDDTLEGGYEGCNDGEGIMLGPGVYWLRFWASSSSPSGYFWYNSNVGNPNTSSAYIDGLGYSEEWAGESFDMSLKISCGIPEFSTLIYFTGGLLFLWKRHFLRR
ncbi:MAG TPA: hypothetical protein VNK96_03310 [Fimbriimonadales bacterium]|nr:hypothetical protein [Fimbriimonadales bacterium]